MHVQGHQTYPQKLLWQLLHQQQQLSMQLLTHLVQLQAPTAQLLPQLLVTLFVLLFHVKKQRTGLQRLGAVRCMMLCLHVWQSCANLQEGAGSLDTVSG